MVWGRSGVGLRSFGCRSEVVLGSIWGWSGVVQGLFWACFKFILRKCWDRFGIVLGLVWGCSGVGLGSFCGRSEFVLWSFWGWSGVVLGSSWTCSGVILRSLWGRSGFWGLSQVLPGFVLGSFWVASRVVLDRSLGLGRHLSAPGFSENPVCEPRRTQTASSDTEPPNHDKVADHLGGASAGRARSAVKPSPVYCSWP